MSDTDQADLAGESDELAAWLRLAHTPGVSLRTAYRLLANFGLPQYVFGVGAKAMERLVGPALAHVLTAPPAPAVARLIARALAWTEQDRQCILTLADARYPRALLDLADPPVLLYVEGDPACLGRPALAVVGSRNASAQGKVNAHAFARSLSAAGLTIISGLALGVDAAAHQGGLDGGSGTVAVVGTGIDLVYPARNAALARVIAREGCIVSEYALGTPGLAANFPRRNRLISGLAKGVLVVEAARHSGSLITAQLALEQGKDVFAIPGSIHATLAKGCNALIKQGAKLVESVQDVLGEYADGVLPTPEPDDDAGQVLRALGDDPQGVDGLAARAGLSVAAVLTQLLALELAGRIEALPGAQYQRLSC